MTKAQTLYLQTEKLLRYGREFGCDQTPKAVARFILDEIADGATYIPGDVESAAIDIAE